MPKLLASLLTLLVALLYGASAMASSGGAVGAMGEVCLSPVGKICVVHGGAVNAHAHSHGHGEKRDAACGVCLESQSCWPQNTDEQLAPSGAARERWVAAFFALVTVQVEQTTFKPISRGPAEECGVWGSDFALFRSTHLLI